MNEALDETQEARERLAAFYNKAKARQMDAAVIPFPRCQRTLRVAPDRYWRISRGSTSGRERHPQQREKHLDRVRSVIMAEVRPGEQSIEFPRQETGTIASPAGGSSLCHRRRKDRCFHLRQSYSVLFHSDSEKHEATGEAA